MPRSSLRLSLFALGGALLLLAACGGGDDPEYFEEVAASEETRRNELFGVLEGEGISGNIAFFEATIPVLEAEERRLSEIEPPEEVVSLHADYLTSRAEVLRVSTAILSRLNEIADGPVAEYSSAFEALASDPDIGIAGYTNYLGSATDACRRLSEVAVADGLDPLTCAERSQIEDAPLSIVTSASCEDRPTRGVSNLSTRTLFINETDHVLRLFQNDATTIYLVDLQPDEAETQGSTVGTLFRAEDENGECIGIYKTVFPAERVQFTGE